MTIFGRKTRIERCCWNRLRPYYQRYASGHEGKYLRCFNWLGWRLSVDSRFVGACALLLLAFPVMSAPRAFQVESRAPVCTCGGVGVCQCGLNCKCAKVLKITPQELWDRCSVGETITVLIGDGFAPDKAFKLDGKLQGKRAGVYGPGVYRVEPDGKGGVQIVSVSRFVSSSCPGGVCPNQR